MRSIGVSVVVPVFNAEASLKELHRELHRELHNVGNWEIIFVDDGSRDNSWEVLKSITQTCTSCVGIQFGTNFGQNLATCEGILLSEHELVVTMDDDLQHSPSWISRFADYLIENQQLDGVFALPAKSGHGLARTIGSRFVNQLRGIFHGADVPYFSSFRILRRALAHRVAQERRLRVSVSRLAYQLSGRIHNLDVKMSERRYGMSGYTRRKLIVALVRNLRFTIAESGSGAAVSTVGIALSFIGVGSYILAFLLGYIGQPGFTTLAVLSVILVGLQFGILAIIFKAHGDFYETQSFRPYVRDRFGIES